VILIRQADRLVVIEVHGEMDGVVVEVEVEEEVEVWV
jgi:hypothetical protein